jgi:phosphonate transport system substrate-binding protein
MPTRRRLAALVLGGLLAACPALAAEPLRLAITDVPGLEQLQVEWGPFKETLETATGLGFEFFPVTSRTVAAEGLRAEQVDFVLTGPAEYVVMRQRADAVPVVSFGRPDYFAGIVVMADSGITSVEDLRGRKIAFEDVGSTSNHLAPAQILADYGLVYGKDYQPVHTSGEIQHASLKRGDVAAIGVNYRTWTDRMRDRDTEVPPGAFRVLLRGGDLPNDVLMAGAHVDPATIERVRAAFAEDKRQMAAAILEGGDENAKYLGMGFVTAVEDRDYDYVRAMYATIGYPEFAEFLGE